MKKSSLVLAVPVLAMSAVLLTGCGMFRSHKAWDKAQQESPLEIPPGLDTPATSAALVIPEPGSGVATRSRETTDSFVMPGTVDDVYHRVGEALGVGDLGQVTAHDDANHTFDVAISPKTIDAKKPGLFKRMMGGHHNDASNDAAAPDARKVTLSVQPSGTGSQVSAQGDGPAVSKVIESLRGRLTK
jgi:uncharacterized lipoprotein